MKEQEKIERLHKLKELIVNNSYKPLKISELASHLNVTEKTIYRDLKVLKKEAVLLKIEDISFHYTNDLEMASKMFLSLIPNEQTNLGKARILEMYLNTKDRYLQFLKSFELIKGVSTNNTMNVNLNIPKEVLEVITQEESQDQYNNFDNIKQDTLIDSKQLNDETDQEVEEYEEENEQVEILQ